MNPTLKSFKKIIKRILEGENWDRAYERSAKKAIEIYHGGGILNRSLALRLHKRNMKKYGCCIPPSITVGKNFYIAHAHGIYLGRFVEIGDNCKIYPGAMMVAALKHDKDKYAPNERKSPKVGNNCLIGAGCRIVGHIDIGDNVLIAAGAIVTKDVPSNTVVKGINGFRPMAPGETAFD